jgi:hypothetical protein
VSLCPTFSAALTSAIEEFMTGKHGRPYTLVEVITWLFNQLVEPKHPIGRTFEMAVREEEPTPQCLTQLVGDPKRLRAELEEFLSPGILNYSTSLERAMLGQLPWSQLPVEFMMVWTFGRARWVVDSAQPVPAGGFKRVSFLAHGPGGRRAIFVSASGETDSEAEEQGAEVVKELPPHPEIPAYVVTLSTENEGSFRKGEPGVVRLHYLPRFLISAAQA